MNVLLQSQFNGHAERIAVLEDGRTVARFEDESEARQWASDEYGIAPESLEFDR